MACSTLFDIIPDETFLEGGSRVFQLRSTTLDLIISGVEQACMLKYQHDHFQENFKYKTLWPKDGELFVMDDGVKNSLPGDAIDARPSNAPTARLGVSMDASLYSGGTTGHLSHDC